MKRIFSFALAGWIACSALTSFAQAPGALGFPTAIDPTTGLPVAVKRDEGPRFELIFMGGHPDELVNEIQSVLKKPINVVIHSDCANVAIPPIRLKGVTLTEIFNTLNTLGEPNFEMGIWRQVPQSETEVWILSKSGNPYYGGGFPVIPASRGPTPPIERACRVFNLGPYLETFTVEDITTAIQGAWELMKSDSNQSLRYHKDTKLLIVVGGKEELGVVNEVLMQLRSSLLKPAPVDSPKSALKP